MDTRTDRKDLVENQEHLMLCIIYFLLLYVNILLVVSALKSLTLIIYLNYFKSYPSSLKYFYVVFRQFLQSGSIWLQICL